MSSSAVPPPTETEALLVDIGLLAEIAAGDRAAFRQLYARYRAPLFSFALRFLGDRGAAEEVLQDAFVKIWRHASAFDPRKSRPFTWAVTILRRTCIDHQRRHRRAPLTTPLSDDDPDDALSTAESARPAAEARENAVRVSRALAGMPAPQRDVLELALFTGLTHAEIAQRLAQPVGSVKTWIRRGLFALRAALNDLMP